MVENPYKDFYENSSLDNKGNDRASYGAERIAPKPRPLKFIMNP